MAAIFFIIIIRIYTRTRDRIFFQSYSLSILRSCNFANFSIVHTISITSTFRQPTNIKKQNVLIGKQYISMKDVFIK